ncbi:MAG TPA: endopeptidase La [Pseudomonadota bacterium]|nr:endopeptidase La [Pseudomonadota bacterium]
MFDNKPSNPDLAPELPVLPLRNMLLLPGITMPFEVGRRSSLRLLETVVRQHPPTLLVAVQRDPQIEEPTEADLYPIVVQAEVLKVVRTGADKVTAVLKGERRRRLQVVQSEPYLQARLLPVTETNTDAVEAIALSLTVKETAQRLSTLVQLPESVRAVLPLLEGAREPGLVADLATALLDAPFADRVGLLSQLDVKARLDAVLSMLQRQAEVISAKERIDKQVQNEFARRQREAVLRQQVKAIQEELGEADSDKDLEQFAERIQKAGMSAEAEKIAKKQLDRLRHIPDGSPEASIQRTYLEWLCDLPWAKRTEDKHDLLGARRILEADHYGLEKVKKRIIEYLAVRKLAPDKKGPILCLVGPPGVGKTSLGRSIATALGRNFHRMSLGGVRDEAEIRGHRRTYIGALPGRVMQAMKRVGAKNPVLLLDEIDKLGHDYRGDPSSALLEVLDPEQNNAFSDHYIEVPFDLSEVIFICTANTLDSIPPALLDRMEVIEIAGYTLTEKQQIAIRHLMPKQIGEHGLKTEQVTVGDHAITEVIERYTREAGVRSLERELAGIVRGVAMKVADNTSGQSGPISVEKSDVAEYLGPPKFFRDLAEHVQIPGVATGLSVTAVGGDILFIEATAMPGKGKLSLTGKLGDVMKESAQAALSWVRAHTDELKLSSAFFENVDLHLHVPQGAIAKDGPSAGIALVSAVVSLLTGRKVRSDVAMTGEVTLRGAVLPVGGIKAKVLAAHRAGLKTVILPERNKKDLVEVPEEVRNELSFVFVSRIPAVLDVVLEPVAGQAATAIPSEPVVPPEVLNSLPTPATPLTPNTL